MKFAWFGDTSYYWQKYCSVPSQTGSFPTKHSQGSLDLDAMVTLHDPNLSEQAKTLHKQSTKVQAGSFFGFFAIFINSDGLNQQQQQQQKQQRRRRRRR